MPMSSLGYIFFFLISTEMQQLVQLRTLRVSLSLATPNRAAIYRVIDRGRHFINKTPTHVSTDVYRIRGEPQTILRVFAPPFSAAKAAPYAIPANPSAVHASHDYAPCASLYRLPEDHVTITPPWIGCDGANSVHWSPPRGEAEYMAGSHTS